VIHSQREFKQLIVEAERLLDENDTIAFIEGCISTASVRSGRPRELSVRALMVALQVQVFEGRFLLTTVPRLLNSLDPATRKRLGITRKNGVTIRQVQHLFERIEKTNYDRTRTDDARYDNLDILLNKVGTAGGHDDAKFTTSIAIDSSDIPSWGKDCYRMVFDADKKYLGNERRASDLDAHWRTKGKKGEKKAFFGYDLTAAVTVPEEGGPDVPRVIKAIRFRPATYKTTAMALACATDVAAKQGSLGDVLVDREYTQSKHGRDFLLPVRALGGEPVFGLKMNQVGVSGHVRGAVIIDGQPFSPSLPQSLRVIHRPLPTETYALNPNALKKYEDQIAARSIYALVPHGVRQPNKAQVYQCPAAAGKLICPLVASSRLLALGTMPAANPPRAALLHSVCDSKFRTFSAAELPLSQRHLHGSTAWRKSYARRNEVERLFSNTKDQTSENLRHGSIRVRGIVKMGLLVALSLASTNRRLAASYDRRQPEPPKRGRGRPRKHPVVVMAETIIATDAVRTPLRI
jgi:hypothetical protein